LFLFLNTSTSKDLSTVDATSGGSNKNKDV
jgi:hypothetical protein